VAIWRPDLRQAKEFDETALVHLDVLYRFALRLSHNRAEAEDLVQETCIRAFRNFHRFNPGTNCRAWLLTILRNIFLNHTRQAGRELPEERSESPAPVPGGPTVIPAAEGSPEDEFFQTVLHGHVDRALKALPAAFREVVVLVDLEGLRYREVAEILGCPVGTVMSRLARARARLRATLGLLAREHGYAKDCG
jgi:RNA polymerase sigma-70 factor (ECF subfamily)